VADGVNDGASTCYRARNRFCIANVRPNGFQMGVIAPEEGPSAVWVSRDDAYAVSVLKQAADDSVPEKSGPSKYRNRGCANHFQTINDGLASILSDESMIRWAGSKTRKSIGISVSTQPGQTAFTGIL
jgi:hypothetical protein